MAWRFAHRKPLVPGIDPDVMKAPRKSRLLAWALALATGIAGVAAGASVPAPVGGDFAVREGDIWVMVGDSITAQKLYTTYLEAFARARYPGLKFVAVNSGRSGEVYINSLVRFRTTIAAYAPTLVTVNYGMNDHAKVFPTEQDFLEKPNSAPQRFVNEVQKLGARLVIASASPLVAPRDWAADGGRLRLTGQNLVPKDLPAGWRSNPANALFAEKLHELAGRNGVPFIDQMTPLALVWGANYGRDRVAGLCRAVKPLVEEPITEANFAKQGMLLHQALKPVLGDADLVAVLPAPDKENLLAGWKGLAGKGAAQAEIFRAYLRDWVRSVEAAVPPFVQVSGYDDFSRPHDLIHPGPTGHLQMAALLFRGLRADGLVSEVSLDFAARTLVGAKKASVRNLSWEGGGVSFQRLDECLPLPIDPAARPALALETATPQGSPRDLFGMSRQPLTVTGLPAGDYELSIDGVRVATASARQLAEGFDTGLLEKGPVAEQCAKLLAAVKSGLLVADVDKRRPPDAVPVPRVLAEAQPHEHLWSLRPASGAPPR